MNSPMKKAQGLPINTIIIAIIGLAVLFVLLFLFLNKGGQFGKATTDCVSLGGKCETGTDCSAVPSGIPVSGSCAQGSVCCRAIIQQSLAAGAACTSPTDCANGQCVNGRCAY